MVIVTSCTPNDKGDAKVSRLFVPSKKHGFRTADCDKEPKNQCREWCFVYSHPGDRIQKGMWVLTDADHDEVLPHILAKLSKEEIERMKELANVAMDGFLREEIGVVIKAPVSAKPGIIRVNRSSQSRSSTQMPLLFAFYECAGGIVERGTAVVFGVVESVDGADRHSASSFPRLHLATAVY